MICTKLCSLVVIIINVNTLDIRMCGPAKPGISVEITHVYFPWLLFKISSVSFFCFLIDLSIQYEISVTNFTGLKL